MDTPVLADKQKCSDTGCCLENLLRAMINWDEWRKKNIYIYIYIYIERERERERIKKIRAISWPDDDDDDEDTTER